MAYDAANPEDVKRREAELRRERREEEADLARVLEDPWGRRAIYRILATCRLFALSYDPGLPKDQQHPEFYDGVRNVGLQLLEAVHRSDPDAWVRMQNEARELEAKRRAVAEAKEE